MNNNPDKATVLFGSSDSWQAIDECLDARGLSCPLPLLKMKLTLKSMIAGQVLNVLTSDPASVNDFTRFCELTEHQLLMIAKLQDQFEFYIQKG